MDSYNFARIFLLFFFKSSLFSNVLSSQVKGVPTSKLSFYDPTKDFTCLDGTATLPFKYVNDDYCDCPDGSDEPGTSACPNGRFTCKNIGHSELALQSSRVNDGVCDCCDGTDEYDSDASCSNFCLEAGRAERERLEREKIIAEQGYEVRVEYAQKGKAKRESIENELNDLKTKLSENKGKFDELRAAKERAESFEKEAKEKQDKEFEELEKQRIAEENLKKSEEAFPKLDTDGNGMISVAEFVSSPLTSDEATEEKVKEKFSGEEEIDKLKLYELWSSVQDLFIEKPIEEKAKEEHAEVKEASEEEERKATDSQEEDRGEGDERDDLDDDDADDEHDKPLPIPPPSEAAKDTGKPEYSDETKRLISIAEQARKEFSEVESEVSSLESRISDNDKLLAIDFGPNSEFLALHGECFEYDDREYTYKLCPFNSATQSSKSGGSDTSLGSWGEWHGSPDLYTKMKYKDGLSCWNGPNRSTDVTVSCGAKNEIVSVAEPNRCEYVMEFKTPAICRDPAHEGHLHEEL